MTPSIKKLTIGSLVIVVALFTLMYQGMSEASTHLTIADLETQSADYVGFGVRVSGFVETIDDPDSVDVNFVMAHDGKSVAVHYDQRQNPALPDTFIQGADCVVEGVYQEDGTIEARAVMIGLNDYDFTEVVSGLEEGDLITIVGAAQLRAQQDEFLNRIRSNTSNPFGGGGGRGFR